MDKINSDSLVSATNGVLPMGDRSTRVDYMPISEKELVAWMPQLRPYSYIFYTVPASVKDLKEDFLVSKLWRMNNLYKVKTKSTTEDEDSLIVRFVMKRAQLVLFVMLMSMHPRVVVLKSRQIGISTLTVLMIGDDMWLIPHLNCGIIAQNQDAADGLKDKISFAWDTMDVEIKEFLGLGVTIDNNSEFGLSNGSKVAARLSFRSGTLQRLAWTEVGKIAANDPSRVTETLSGSFNAIAATKSNFIVSESTAEGDNYFKHLFEGAVAKVGKAISNKQMRPLFFSFLTDKDCRSLIDVEVDDRVRRISTRIEREFTAYISGSAYREQLGNFVYPEGWAYKLDDEQLWWLQGALEEVDWDLELFHREYPHTPDSAFYISNEASWFRSALAKCEEDGLITADEAEGKDADGEWGISPLYKPEYEVFAACDIGLRDPFHIIIYQAVDTGLTDKKGLPIIWRTILSEIYGTDAKTDVYGDALHACPYDIDLVILPHDGARGTVLKDSVSVEQDFLDMSFAVHTLNVTVSKVKDILQARKALKYTRIDALRAHHTLASIKGYKKKYDKVLRRYTDTPVHDWASHGADAFLYLVACPRTSEMVNKASVFKDEWVEDDTVEDTQHGSYSV